MFILNSLSGSTAFYIFENNRYLVGRKACDFLIMGDTSISKNHAVISFTSDLLEIEDVGAKYNTFLNGVKLETNKKVGLKDGDTLRFGILKSVFKIEERKLMVTCSGLTTDNKERLTQIIKSLNGKLVSVWSQQLTHVIVEKIVLTVKVLCAIIEGVPIVSLAFWQDFAKCIEKNHPPPLESQYLPKPADFIQKNISFDFKPQRKTLFSNKIFVFKKKCNLEDIIISAGGKCILFNEEIITEEKLKGSNPQYLLIQENDQKADSSHPFNKLIQLLPKINQRAIPQPEIALAIITCSCKTNCNPNFDRAGSLLKGTSEISLPSQPIVAETESFESKTQNSLGKPSSAKVNIVLDSMENDVVTPSSLSSNFGTKSSEIIEINECVQDDDDVVFVEPSKKEVGGGKRVADHISSGETKRQKIEGKNQSVFWAKPSTSKSNGNLSNFFTSTPNQSLNTNSFASTSLSQISKRKSSDVEDEKPTKGKRPRIVKNPFATSDTKPNLPLKESLGSTLRQQSTEKSIKTEQNIRYEVKPLSENYQNQFPWRSVNDEIDVEIKEESNDVMGMLTNSFRDCVVVKNASLVVEKTYTKSGYQAEQSGTPKNFKKFKKVQPLHMQTTIMSSFVNVVCENACVGANTDSYEE